MFLRKKQKIGSFHNLWWNFDNFVAFLQYWLWYYNMMIIIGQTDKLRYHIWNPLFPCLWFESLTKPFFMISDNILIFSNQFWFVAVGVRLQRAVLKCDSNPVHRAACPWPGGNLRPLCQGEIIIHVKYSMWGLKVNCFTWYMKQL